MRLTKTSLFLLAWLVVLLASPLAHSKSPSPYAGNQGNPSTTTVHGYTKKDGTVVAPYQRTAPRDTDR